MESEDGQENHGGHRRVWRGAGATGGRSAGDASRYCGAGADGVEIRRELFNSEELLALPALGESIELLGLLACYSAPAALFMPDGTSTRTCRGISQKPAP